MSVQQEAFRVAVTGGTGFVGRTTIAQACALGLPLNALARQPQAACAGVTWVNGALDRDDCLQRLMADADVVLHIAGVVNAPDKAGFHTRSEERRVGNECCSTCRYRGYRAR